MDNKTRQKQYRKSKQKSGHKYFSVLVPLDLYKDLKKTYLVWKIEQLKKSEEK